MKKAIDVLRSGWYVLGKSDEVLVPANTYIASVMGITANGATPIFIEPNAYYTDKTEEKITPKTKAILFVNYIMV